MKIAEVREWLKEYAKANNDEVLAHNVDKFDDYKAWREYAIRKAQMEGVKIGQHLIEKEAESVEEVKALKIVQSLYGRGFISRYGVVYYPEWLQSEDEDITVGFSAVSTPEEILARYGKLMKLLDGLSEGEKNILKKLI